MKEITQEEYEKLRGNGVRLIGRVQSHSRNTSPIFYQIEEKQKGFCATEILDTLTLTHCELKGKFDVFRHWASPDVDTIDYKNSR